MIIRNDIPSAAVHSPLTASLNEQRIRNAAIKLEATFLTEMLKSAGVGESSETFGGGIGEDQFGSFLRDTQAMEMARSGGVGLADALFEAMKGNGNARI